MSTAETIKQQKNRAVPPRLMGRIAGALYFAAVFTAVLAEFIAPGRLPEAATVAIPVGCYVAVTLLLYVIFRAVNGTVALLAMSCGLVGLACESLRLQIGGVNLGMAFHAPFCLAMGWLMMRSGFLPRIFGVLMVLAGVVWLTYLLPPLAEHLAPYITMAGLPCEVAPMLWLLMMGVRADGLKEVSR